MSTNSPDLLAKIDDYATSTMSDDEGSRFEEQMFDLAAEGTDAATRFVDKTAQIAGRLLDRHTYDAGATTAQIEELRRSGLRIHFVDLGDARGRVDIPRWGEDVQLVVLRSKFDLSGVESIDVEMGPAHDKIAKVVRDVRFEQTDNALHACCEPTLASTAFGSGGLFMRVIALRNGKREELGAFEGRLV